MSITSSSYVYASRRELALARLNAYLELSKPRIASLVLVVVAVSAFAGHWGPPQLWIWLHTLLGTALVAASASTFNQLLERSCDARMERTAGRPLPSGRLTTKQAISFGVVTLAIGVAELTLLVNMLAALLGGLTWLFYVVLYTPLKSKTAANTAVGAVAGALPVLIGWAAVGASFSITGGPLPDGMYVAALFLIVYLWQFPHFMAIAWIYRHQYSAAGLQMLTVVDSTGRRAGAQAVLGALALAPISLLPALQMPSRVYLAGALSLSIAYLAAAVLFCWRRDQRSARFLLQTSLVYLPVLLILLVLSPWV
ncbi:MAG TPA: heme o synthase [Pirellulales bacterium]|nr:heme o synthase [Pirellulales bacterium]